MPNNSKMREIAKLYAKARATGAGKGKDGKSKGGKGGKSRGPPLDRRMKKDKKSMKRAELKAKGKGRSSRKGRF